MARVRAGRAHGGREQCFGSRLVATPHGRDLFPRAWVCAACTRACAGVRRTREGVKGGALGAYARRSWRECSVASANRCCGLPAVAGAKEGGAAVSWGRAEVSSQCRGTRREVGEEGGGMASSAPAPERLRRAVRVSSLLLSSLDVCRGGYLYRSAAAGLLGLC